MHNPGNLFAIVALVLWVPLTFYFFARFKVPVAATLSIVGGSLFLPEHVQILLPVFPDLDKTTIPVIATFLACMWKAPRKLSQAGSSRIDLCFLIVVVGIIGTWLTNGDVLLGGPEIRMGYTGYDALTYVMFNVVALYALFFLGRALFTRGEDIIAMFRTMLVLGMIYSVFCAVELRFSPQMHNWVYGFAQHDFSQTMRGGGYRPMVFMSHGIVLARYMAVAALAGLALWRMNALSSKEGWGLLITIVALMACKSTGAIVLFVIFLPLIAFARSSSQSRMTMAIAVFVTVYPILHALDYLPIEKALELAANVSEERADSLATRFENESALLVRARERIWFGWGGNNRHQLFDKFKNEKLIVDGEWIGILTSRGIVGFVGYYAFYVLPLFLAVRRARSMFSNDYALVLGALMLVTTLLVIDTIPNSSLTLPTLFWTGALAGAANGIKRQDTTRRTRERELRKRPVPAAGSDVAA